MKEKNNQCPSQSKQKESVTDNIGHICDKKTKNFIPNAVNPNNGTAYETYSNPLSSKGN